MTIRYCLNIIIFNNYHFINFYVVKFPVDNFKFLLNFLATFIDLFCDPTPCQMGKFQFVY